MDIHLRLRFSDCILDTSLMSWEILLCYCLCKMAFMFFINRFSSVFIAMQKLTIVKSRTICKMLISIVYWQMLEPKAAEQAADLGLLGFSPHSVSEPCSPSCPSASPIMRRTDCSFPAQRLSYPDLHCSTGDANQTAPTSRDACKPPYLENSEIWKDRKKEVKGGGQESGIEKREQGEGESASETISVGARPTSSSSSSSPLVIPRLCLDRSFNTDALTSPSTDDEEEEEEEEDDEDSDEGFLKRRSMVESSPSSGQQSGGLSVQRSLHRRTHSEGSLLQEPRSPRFISDQAIDCIEAKREPSERWAVPSPQTLRKELIKNGGSVHQICLLFTGRRVRTTFIYIKLQIPQFIWCH